MRPSGKWIDGICPDGSVEDAARRSLEARLASVNHWLPLAAYLAEQDIEHVHRLRVSTRRAVAALRLYDDWLPRGQARWMKKRLRKIRRAAGDARDLDVLAPRLARDYGERAAPVVALIARERAAVQPVIVAVAERSRRRDQFVRKTSKLLAGIRPPDKHQAQSLRFRDWAALRLLEAAHEFFAALPSETADTAALHEFRIRAKALRYTIELVAPAFGPELRKQHYSVVEEIQERLGKAQDHVAAGERLNNWAERGLFADHRPLLLDLAAGEKARLTGALNNFRDWWSCERINSLRSELTSFAP